MIYIAFDSSTHANLKHVPHTSLEQNIKAQQIGLVFSSENVPGSKQNNMNGCHTTPALLVYIFCLFIVQLN